MLSEQAHGTISILIHLIHQRISVFGKTRSKDYQLIITRHDFEEVVHTWPFLNIDAAYITFDIHWDYVVWVFNLIELTVHQSFI